MNRILFFLAFCCSFLQAQNTIFQKVEKHLLKGDYQKALSLLKKEPQSVDVLRKTAQIFHSVGNYGMEINCYQKILKKEPDHQNTSVLLAKAYVLYGTYKKAIPIYEKIIKKDSLNNLIINRLASLYLRSKKNKKALKLYQILEEKDSLNPYYSYQKGIAFERMGDFYEKGNSFLDAYKKDSTHFKSILKLAHFFKKLRIKDSTMLFVNKGLIIDSLSVSLNMIKATELFSEKKYDQTLSHIKKIKSYGFSSAFIFEIEGMCYFKKKEYQLAEESFKKGLKIDFKDLEIRYRLANVYYEQKKYKPAKRELLLSFYFAEPKLTKSYFLLATIYKNEKKLPKAIEYFEKSYKNDKSNYKALFELAVASNAYYKDKKIALKYYDNFLERFKKKDIKMTLFAKQQVKSLKKELFIKGN